MPETAAADWIAVDWGSSNLRAWAMTDAGDALAEAVAATGASGLDPEGFEPALLAAVGDWLGEGARTDVVGLRHGGRAWGLDRGALCGGALRARAGGVRAGADPGSRGWRCASCRGCGRMRRRT